MRHLASSLIILCVLFSGQSFAQSNPRSEATKAEEKEARELAVKFSLLFADTQDLTPIIKDLYFSDFVERYRTFKTKTLKTKPVDLYFAPGLEYNSQLLTAADSKDWQNFYVATNNFLMLGFISVLKANPEGTGEIRVSDIYPSKVIELLHKDPILANMIERKGPAKAVGTVEEMRAATATLSQAVTMIHDQNKSGPLITKKDELAKVMMEDELFKPRVQVVDDDFFGFPKNTRVLFIRTPIGLQLMLARDADRLKIFWSEMLSD